MPEAHVGFWRGLFERIGRALLWVPLPVAVVLPFLWMGLIWHLSSQSFDPPVEPSGLVDYIANLAHAPLFGFLALFWCAFLMRGAPVDVEGARLPRLAPWQGWLTMVFVAAYAVLDEWHQSLTPGRDPSAGDVATDLVGGACVLWVVAALGRSADERALRRRLWLGLAACLGVTAVGVAIRRLG